MNVRDQSAQRPAVDRPLVEVTEKDHRHGRCIKTLQRLLAPWPSFTRSEPQMRCDNTPRLTVATEVRIQRAARFKAPERQVERTDRTHRKARRHRTL